MAIGLPPVCAAPWPRDGAAKAGTGLCLGRACRRLRIGHRALDGRLHGGLRSGAVACRSRATAPDNPRLGMLRSVECRLRIGMAQKDVLLLLGPPDTTLSANAFAYALGVSPYGIDHGELVIELDENSRLTRHYWRRL